MGKPKQIWLNEAEYHHILRCLQARDEGVDAGWYYGNKKEFEKRHAALLSQFGFTPNTGEKP